MSTAPLRHRLNLASFVLIGLVMCLAAAGALFGPQPGDTDYRLGLDFPAFYGAGRIVADGEIDSLYEPEVQKAAQADMMDNDLMYFPYPQPVAIAYAPLTLLPPIPAYILHTALMMGALIAAIQLLRPIVKWVDEWPAPATAGALLCIPMAQAVTLGQNTAFSLLLIVGAWRLLRDHRDIEAGVVLAIACNKPQIGLVLIGLLFLGRRYRVAYAAGVMNVLTYLGTALFAGWRWPLDWLHWVAWFNPIETSANTKNLVSLSGTVMVIFGTDSAVGSSVTVVAITGLCLAMAFMWWTNRYTLDQRFALTLIGLVLASPHAYSHDAALALPALALLIDRLSREQRWIPASIFMLMVIQGFSGELGFSVAPLALVAMAIMLIRTDGVSWEGRSDATPPATTDLEGTPWPSPPARRSNSSTPPTPASRSASTTPATVSGGR